MPCSYSSGVKKASRLSHRFSLFPTAGSEQTLKSARGGCPAFPFLFKINEQNFSLLVPSSHLFVRQKMIAFDWLTRQVPSEPRQFCISTDCCHYQSLLSRVIKFKIKGILHVCAILHKAYLLIDQLLYYTLPATSHCLKKPHVRMGTRWGRPWLPAGNIVLPSVSGNIKLPAVASWEHRIFHLA